MLTYLLVGAFFTVVQYLDKHTLEAMRIFAPFFFSVLFLSICIFFSNEAIAQEYSVFSGKIFSSKDSSAISYTHIGIPKYGIGCLSNDDGYFQFFIPTTATDSVVISHISFGKKLICLQHNIQDTLIYMLPKTQQISEITIFPRDTLVSIIAQMKRRLLLNSPKKKHQFGAFYRELQYEKNDSVYTRLLEAAVDIEDGAYKKDLGDCVLKINELRKSSDSNEKSDMLKMMSTMFDFENNLTRCYASWSNVSRSYMNAQKSSHWHPLKVNEGWMVDTTLVGTIDEGRIVELELLFNRQNRIIQIVRLTIERGSYALLKAEHKMYVQSKLMFAYESHYKMIDQVLYPVLLKDTRVSDVREKNGKRTFVFSENTLMINQIVTDKQQFVRIGRKEKMKKTADLYKQEFIYKPEFWKNYNTLLKAPINSKVMNDLEKETRLEEQFINNGKKKE